MQLFYLSNNWLQKWFIEHIISMKLSILIPVNSRNAFHCETSSTTVLTNHKITGQLKQQIVCD